MERRLVVFLRNASTTLSGTRVGILYYIIGERFDKAQRDMDGKFILYDRRTLRLRSAGQGWEIYIL